MKFFYFVLAFAENESKINKITITMKTNYAKSKINVKNEEKFNRKTPKAVLVLDVIASKSQNSIKLFVFLSSHKWLFAH